MDDKTGLFDWRSDIRATVSVMSEADVDEKAVARENVLGLWVTTP